MKEAYENKGSSLVLRLHKDFYPREVIIQASYVKLEKFYIYLDQDEDYYLVDLRYKEESKNNKNELEGAVKEFLDELIEARSYLDQLKRSAELRQTILERALLSQQDFKRDE